MLTTIRMPQMGVSDESAILSKWLVCEGGRIRRGQPVFSLETDKATFQYEAESDGFLVRILTGEGEEAAIGSPVGIVSDVEGVFADSDMEALLKGATDKERMSRIQVRPEGRDEPEAAPESAGKRSQTQNVQEANRKVSPRARRKADELGVDLTMIRRGSGPEGRILECDVIKTVRTNRAEDKSEQKKKGIYPGRPLMPSDRVNVRKIEPENATGQTGYVSRLFDARRILAFCTPQNGLTAGTAVCRELAHLLIEKHELNARRHADRIYEYGTAHLRLTVATPSGTLKPVIRCAEEYTLNELNLLIRNAASRCRRFASKPQEFQEGTFTVADLSEFGADFFTPELTPPELCALGIGAAVMQAKPDERGGIEAYPAIRLTLAYDCAGIDAFQAANFLNELALRLEQGGTHQSNISVFNLSERS